MTNGGPDPVLYFSMWIGSILLVLLCGTGFVIRWVKRLLTVTQRVVDNNVAVLEILREKENRKDQE